MRKKIVGMTAFFLALMIAVRFLIIAVICVCFFVFSYLASGKIKRVEVRELIAE